MWIYLNGRIVDEAEARISVLDRGFLYGDGVFETVRVHHGRPVWLDRHLARLAQSCRAIDLDAPRPAAGWRPVFQRVIDRNRLDQGLIRLTLSRGVRDAGDEDAAVSAPTTALIPRPLRRITARQRREGIPVVITAIRRPSPLSSPTHAKTLNYLNSLLAAREAAARGAFEGVQLAADGHVAECAMSNVFFLLHRTLHTPSTDCGVLPGITRGIVLDIASALGLRVREGRYAPDMLRDAEECFLTGSGIGILPVRSIDGRPLPTRWPGSLTETLQRRYDCLLDEHEG